MSDEVPEPTSNPASSGTNDTNDQRTSNGPLGTLGTQVNGVDPHREYFYAKLELAKFAWESFDKRRPWEWKVCLSLWAAMAAFLGTAATGSWSFSTGTAVGVIGFAVGLVLLHGFWIVGFSRAQDFDKRLCHAHLDEISKALSPASRQHAEVEAIRTYFKTGSSSLWTFSNSDDKVTASPAIWLKILLHHWSPRFQVSVTILLALACALLATLSLLAPSSRTGSVVFESEGEVFSVVVDGVFLGQTPPSVDFEAEEGKLEKRKVVFRSKQDNTEFNPKDDIAVGGGRVTRFPVHRNRLDKKK